MLEFISSTRSYLIQNIADSWGVTTWMVQYIFLFGILYLIGIFILHKIHHGFVILAQKKKAEFYFACDAIIYEYQKSQNTDLSRIQQSIKKGSYENDYKIFVEKSNALGGELGPKLVSSVKRGYGKYKSASGAKIALGSFLVLITLGIYLLFRGN